MHGYDDLCYTTHDIIIFYDQKAPSQSIGALLATTIVPVANWIADQEFMREKTKYQSTTA